MKKTIFLFTMAMMAIALFCNAQQVPAPLVYEVAKRKGPMTIDANWNKRAWRQVKEITITNYMGEVPAFRPVAKAKMMYDAENVYVIFNVDDKFVRLRAERFNDKVFEDACVEFFFSPDSNNPLHYFNLEMNAGGTALMEYHAGTSNTRLKPEDFETLTVAHTMPRTLEKDMEEPVNWTVEYRLPLAMLKRYANVSMPAKGVTWKANFFKTSSRSANPHYITWSFVNNKTPRFHMPEYFGELRFK